LKKRLNLPEPHGSIGLREVAISVSSFVCKSSEKLRLFAAAGPDFREGKLGSCPGPPQLGVSTTTVKTRGKILS